MRRAAVLVACVALTACGAPHELERANWEKFYPIEPKKIYVHVLRDLDHRCRPGMQGCAEYHTNTGICDIYIARGANESCERAHWVKHCYGYDHPKQAGHEFACEN